MAQIEVVNEYHQATFRTPPGGIARVLFSVLKFEKTEVTLPPGPNRSLVSPQRGGGHLRATAQALAVIGDEPRASRQDPLHIEPCNQAGGHQLFHSTVL